MPWERKRTMSSTYGLSLSRIILRSVNCRDRRGLQGHKVRRETRESLVPRAPKAPSETRALQDRQAPKAHRVTQGRQAHKDPREIRDPRARQGRRDRRALTVWTERTAVTISPAWTTMGL